MLRNIEHTAVVHGFMASLTEKVGSAGREVMHLDPTHRASRHLRYGNLVLSIFPDALATLLRSNVWRSFFLEWERRAVRLQPMSEHLTPHLWYYSTYGPTDDHGARSTVLLFLNDDLATSCFLRVVSDEMARAKVDVPLQVAYISALERLRPLGTPRQASGHWGHTSVI